MRVFVSLAAGPDDARIVTALKMVRSEAEIILADVASAEALLVIATLGAPLQATQAHLEQAGGKPILAILEQGVELDVPEAHVARFHRPTADDMQVFTALLGVARAATAAGLGGALSGLAVAAMGQLVAKRPSPQASGR